MRKLLMAATAVVPLLAAGAAWAQPIKEVAPGTITVHLNGRFQFEMVDYGSTFNTVGGNKLNPVTAAGELRLYPGFDAETLSGIAYGVQVELRDAFSDAGKGVNANAATTSGTGSMYVRRAYGYIGTTDYGYFRFGQTDAATSLLEQGVIYSFGDGDGWKNRGGIATTLPSYASPINTIVWGDQVALYGSDKIVYISPKIYGFNAIASYEPNSNGLKEGYANCTTANSTCAALSSSGTASDIGSRRKNTVDAGLQYTLQQYGVLARIAGTYLHSATLSYTGVSASSGPLNYTAGGRGYSDMNAYQFGAQVTYAGFTLGGNVKFGQVNDAYSFVPKGGRGAFVYDVGFAYNIGPYVIGANYFDSQTSGTYDPTRYGKEARTLNENGVIVGANYVIGKDMNVFLQYMYGQRHQYGNAQLSATGNAQTQAVGMGATLKW
ncbi:MAG: porin [Acidocella sp.]|nr:porin [Acidocella sp.]